MNSEDVRFLHGLAEEETRLALECIACTDLDAAEDHVKKSTWLTARAETVMTAVLRKEK